MKPESKALKRHLQQPVSGVNHDLARDSLPIAPSFFFEETTN